MISQSTINELDPVRAGFFGWMAGAYIDLKQFGPKGIKLWQKRMDGLKEAYRKMGAKENGGPEEFLYYVPERDSLLGIAAGGDIIDENSFKYWINTKQAFGTIWNQIDEQDYKNITLNGFIKTKRDFFVPYHTVIHEKNMFTGDDMDEFLFTKE